MIFSFLAKNRAFFRKKWENQTALMTIFFEKTPQEQCKFQKNRRIQKYSHINVFSKAKLLKCLKKAQNYNTLTILLFRMGGIFPRVFIRICEEIKVISYHLYGLMRHPWLRKTQCQEKLTSDKNFTNI